MTKRKYRVQPIAFHRWQSSHNHLVNYRYPLLSLRIGRSWKDPQMHYRLIIGDGVTWEKNNYVRWWRLFRWTWEKRWTQIDYYRWYYMRDHIDSERVNGKKKKIDFWEIAGRSYQSQLLLLKKR